MKKIAFALQVFGLITILPISVFLEMNHAAGRFTVNKTISGVKEEAEKNTIRVTLNSEAENENSIPGKMLTVSTCAFKQDQTINGVSKAN
ncbi:MAG: hypothetical protein ABI760_05705 [Ferruginibacter sp.]